MDFSFAIFFVTKFFAKIMQKNGTKQVNELDGAMGNRFLDSGTTCLWFWYDMFLVLVRRVSGSGTTCFRLLIRRVLGF